MARPGLTVILVPDESGASRSYRVSGARLGLLKVLGAISGTFVLVFLLAVVFLTREAMAARSLRARLVELEVEARRVEALALQLEDLESRYLALVGLFQEGVSEEAPQLWLPPPGGSPDLLDEAGVEGSLALTWPLSAPGFVTRGLLEDEELDHQGVDIAVPTGTYITAAAPGVVEEVGQDEIYGIYVRIDHGNGYTTLYAHASESFVSAGDPVRRREVIALSGSTGRSTAPHLHFEVRLGAQPVNPLELVTQPN